METKNKENKVKVYTAKDIPILYYYFCNKCFSYHPIGVSCEREKETPENTCPLCGRRWTDD